MTVEVHTEAGPAIRTRHGDVLLRDLFDYDPSTGELVWKPRREEWCHDARACGTWNAKHSGKHAGHIKSDGYLVVSVFCIPIRGHRIAFALHKGCWPKGVVDHENHIRDDNRATNLVDASGQRNSKNQALSRANTSGVIGVSWNMGRQKWQARIGTSHRKSTFLGLFNSIEEAAAARKLASAEHGYHSNHGMPLAP